MYTSYFEGGGYDGGVCAPSKLEQIEKVNDIDPRNRRFSIVERQKDSRFAAGLWLCSRPRE